MNAAGAASVTGYREGSLLVEYEVVADGGDADALTAALNAAVSD